MSRIAYVDMDGVIVDLAQPLVNYLNDYTGKSYEVKDINIYHLEKFYGVDRRVLDDIFSSYNFWWKAPAYPEGVEAVRLMVDAGMEVYLATTPINNVSCYVGKLAWVRENIPEIKKDRVIFIHHKRRLLGDFLIDDRIDVLNGFSGVPILFDRPWNKETPDFWHLRASNWSDILSIVGI